MFRPFSYRCCHVAWVTLVAIAPLACHSNDGLEKAIVSGQVSYDGKPIENGQIYFYPQATTRGPVSGAPIHAGTYRAEAKGGVPVGTHRVKVEAYRALAGGEAADLTSGSAGAPQQFLPPKYNVHTELELTVPAGQSEVTHDFHLTP